MGRPVFVCRAVRIIVEALSPSLLQFFSFPPGLQMETLTGAVAVASVFPGRVAGVSCAAHEGRPSAEAFLAVTVYHGAHLIPEDLEHGVSETRWVFKTNICQDKKAP